MPSKPLEIVRPARTASARPRIVDVGEGAGLASACEALRTKPVELVGVLCDHPSNAHEESVRAVQQRYGLGHRAQDIAGYYGVEYKHHRDLNDTVVVEWLHAQGAELLLCFGPRTIFRGPMLERFAGKILNVHTAPLPTYRGGATDSWMILLGEQSAYGVCHLIDQTIDGGPIYATAPYAIPPEALPIDIHRARTAIVPKLVERALANYFDPHFQPAPQELSRGFYLPKLSTERDGEIDWSLPADAVERMIRAFSDPYPGAWTFLEQSPDDVRRLSIGRARVVDSAGGLHPFARGLIIRKTDNRWCVATGQGIVEIWDLRWGAGGEAPRLLGKRFSSKRGVMS